MKTKSAANPSIWIVLCVIAALALPATALAFHHGPGDDGFRNHGFGKSGGMRHGACGLWQNQKMVDALELSDAQVAKLREADFAMRAKAIDIHAERQRLELKLQQAFTADPLNDAQIMDLARQLADVNGQKTMQRVESRLALHKILTADQLKKLQALHQERFQNQGKGKKGSGKQRGMRSERSLSVDD